MATRATFAVPRRRGVLAGRGYALCNRDRAEPQHRQRDRHAPHGPGGTAPMETLQNFWALVVEVWSTGVLGISVGRSLLALLILLFFLLLRRLFSRAVAHWLRRLAKRSKSTVDDAIIDALEPPIALVFVIFGLFVAAEFMQLEGVFAEIADNLIKSLIIVAIFWSFYRLVDPLRYVLRRLEAIFNRELVDWLVRAIKIGFLALGGAAILQTWGIQVAPLLAGLGIFGVAVALGAQDFFKNLIGGLSIIAEQRFKVGEWIFADGVVEGTVEKINFRSTLVRRFDKAPVYVPNSQLADGSVTNFSRMTYRRIRWMVGVEYRTTVPQLRKIRDEIEAFILGDADFVAPSEASTFVRIDSFNDSSIDIMVYCFTKSTVWGEWLATKERLAYRIKDIVEGAGSGFAFPSRSLYVETLREGAPERFVPPGGGAGERREQDVRQTVTR
jgi:MscS family membrane protein